MHHLQASQLSPYILTQNHQPIPARCVQGFSNANKGDDHSKQQKNVLMPLFLSVVETLQVGCLRLVPALLAARCAATSPSIAAATAAACA